MINHFNETDEEGLEFQDFVIDELLKEGLGITCYSSKKYQFTIGENKAGIEIKYDKKSAFTGNLYIEIAEKRNSSNEHYISSGIYRNDNSWLYLIGNYERIFIFSIKDLKLSHKENLFEFKETGTSQGFLLPIAEAETRALRVIKTDMLKHI